MHIREWNNKVLGKFSIKKEGNFLRCSPFQRKDKSKKYNKIIDYNNNNKTTCQRGRVVSPYRGLVPLWFSLLNGWDCVLDFGISHFLLLFGRLIINTLKWPFQRLRLSSEMGKLIPKWEKQLRSELELNILG